MSKINHAKKLSWNISDPEQRLGIRAGRFTNVNTKLCALLAVLCTVGVYTILYMVPANPYTLMFTDRGVTPPLMVLLSLWTLFTLVLKWLKIRLQQRALKISILPHQHDFVLSPNTVDQVLRNLNEAVEQPKQFFLFNRVIGALSNLKNIGMISDVGDILRSYNDQDIESMETSYSILHGFLWAIPVLGFIGTVEGLSSAIGSFGKVLASGADASALTTSLQSVTGGLATAFETTLIALILALSLHLLATLTKKKEEDLLIACSDYCSQNIVSHLRMPGYRNEQNPEY
ncbi:MAG: MotA/TolQ/ExbB proton channel family protein [Thermoguttaceae bacterium]